MLLKVFFAVVILAVLQSVQGSPKVDKGIWVVIVSKGTGKVVASDGTLWDFGKGEEWKQWLIYTQGHSPYYLLKSGTDGRPELFPYPAMSISTGSLVLGTQDFECSASRVKKVSYHENDDSQTWKIYEGVGPIYNNCSTNNQLIVEQAGNYTMIYTISPSNVKEGDKNSLFEVVPTKDYKKNMMVKK